MFDFGASHNGSLRGGQPTRGVCSAGKGVFSEMNKCLTLVHLTTAQFAEDNQHAAFAQLPRASLVR